MASATDFIISLINQDGGKRLLKLYFPRDDGPSAGLLVNELHAVEHVSADFIYTVTVLSDDAGIELKDVLAKMVCIELLRADGSSRYFNGYCHTFALQRIENGLAVYQMILKPWLAFYNLRKDYHIFHEQNIAQQTKKFIKWKCMNTKVYMATKTRPMAATWRAAAWNKLTRKASCFTPKAITVACNRDAGFD